MYRVHAAGLTRFSRRNLDPVNQHHLDFDLDFCFFLLVFCLVFWFFILAFFSKRLKSKSESIVTPEELNS